MGFLKNFFVKQYSKLINSSKIIYVAGETGKTTTILACKFILENKIKISMGEKIEDVFKTSFTADKIIYEIKKDHRENLLDTLNPSTVIVTNSPYLPNGNFNFEEDQSGKPWEEEESLERTVIQKIPENSLLILNGDDLFLRKSIPENISQTLFYGTQEETCQIWAGRKRLQNFRTLFELNYGVERVEISSNLLGFHQVYPLLAAAALGISLDIPLLTIKKGLEKLPVSEHKMQVLEGINGSFIIDDTCNDNFIATRGALESLNHISARRRVVVLGGIDVDNNLSGVLGRELARIIYKDKIDLVFLVGEDSIPISDELNKLGFITERIQTSITGTQIVGKLAKILAKGDVVLIKGSHNVRLDEVVKRISKHKKT